MANAFLDSELAAARAELGYNNLSGAAEPYISYTLVFDEVIQKYVSTGLSTTSSTAVVAATAATAVTLVMASAVIFAPNDLVGVDVDDRFEQATVQAVSGTSLTLLLLGAHSGAYPIVSDAGVLRVRECLREIRNVKKKISRGAGAAGLKRAEDIEWYEKRKGGSSLLQDLSEFLSFWRDELASALGVVNLWNVRKRGAGGSGSVALY